jgi:hypothetical protein
MPEANPLEAVSTRTTGRSHCRKCEYRPILCPAGGRTGGHLAREVGPWLVTDRPTRWSVAAIQSGGMTMAPHGRLQPSGGLPGEIAGAHISLLWAAAGCPTVISAAVHR